MLTAPNKTRSCSHAALSACGEPPMSFSMRMCACVVLFTSILLGSGYTCLAKSQGGTNDCLSTSKLVDLDPGHSISLSRLTCTNGSSVLVGDKLFGDFSFQYTGTDTRRCDALRASSFRLTALSNDVGFGVSFSGPMSALGNATKDVVFRFSITVTNSSQLISGINLDYNGTVLGSGFSSVTESAFTGGFGGTPIDQISVFDVGGSNQMEAAATLPTPEQEIFVEKDVIFGGGAVGNQNAAFISVIDQTFAQVSEVPEPSTILLVVSGLATLFFVKRRK
jgi:PEP-CTERM motif-containing protein